ncbi:MAG: SH3 domain-containing protein [Treponema sp.]|nr:SH3 domain-containing protein [Treponema sp.]
MKKTIFYAAASILLAFCSTFLISCKDKVMGYSVLLWNLPEYKIQSGDILPVYIRSNISQVYVVGIDGEKVEIPLWQLTDPVKKAKVGSVSKKYQECAHTYASVKIDGLPCRAEPVNTAKQVYRLRKGEVIKLLYIGNGQAPMTGGQPLEGNWYRILTKDGTQGWCFSYNLNLYETDENGEQVGGQILEEEAEDDNYYISILDKAWYPDSFSTMISSGNIDISKLHPSYNFTIDTVNNKVSLNMSGIHESWDYTGYTKTDDYEYTLNDIPIIIIYKKSTFIVVRYTGESGKPQELNLVTLDDDINAIVAEEKQRRADAYSKVASATGELSSSSYGKLSLNTDGTFKWSGYKLLVPAVISAGAKTAGTCSVKYAVSKELAASYDGVLTFKFEGTTDEVNFLYKLENDGLRLEAANDATYNGILVTGRSSSPLIMYFR